MEPRVWLIGGPTASGKSALASRLAQALGAEIVNADSMQLYADLRVLTARPETTDEARAPHHLYGVADAAEAWSVGRWLRAATDALAQIGSRERPAVVVGGTGLYFRALAEGLADIPEVPMVARERARAHYVQVGEAAYRAELRILDPQSEARIAPGDRQRLVRAFEVAEGLGRPLGAWQADAAASLPTEAWSAVVLEPPRAELYARCDARLEIMAHAGALDEVARLMARGLGGELPAMKTLGVREFAACLRGETTLAEATAAAQRHTRNYAKRQSTWFRNQTPHWPRIIAPDPQAQWNAMRTLAGLT